MRRARADHHLALLGEGARGAVDEGGAELPLEPGDVGRHVGLHRVQGAGGGGEAAVSATASEGVELAEIHRWK